MARQGDFYIDKKTLNQLRKDLTKVFPTNAQTNTAIVRGMKKAAAPLVSGLKLAIKNKVSDEATGKLANSIKIFRAKKLDKYKRPSIYVGPKVKPPKKYRNKKGDTKAQRAINAKAREKWIAEQAGFYFYFLEYGFKPWGKGDQYLGLGLLPQVVNSKGNQTLSSLYSSIADVIKKSAKRKGINIS